MTKDDIKKAYEICASANDCSSCNDCPDCANCASAAAFNLITEQENEIERLRTTLGQCNTELNSALESLKSQCREIGELKAGVKQAQIDVLNKVKERAVVLAAIETYHVCNLIDGLIKEVQNDNSRSN